jgi:SacI restriction endonuclease
VAIIHAESTRGILARANERSKAEPGPAVAPQWTDLLEVLTSDKCPKTYLAVTCVLLVARAMHPREELNVLEIQQGDSVTGYSAPSIGKLVASFAKEHHIDLRATSSQPLNNQPFTYKSAITLDMSVQANKQVFWHSFFQGAQDINSLDTDEALNVLAFIFSKQTKTSVQKREFQVAQIAWAVLDDAVKDLAEFVNHNSGAGKVGQAFGSALLDLLYSSEAVEQGNSQDPDASTPGDVHVRDKNGQIWLWVEVKQAPVQSGQVQGFIDKVAAHGGERILYLALKNHNYPSDISIRKIETHAAKNNIRLTIFQSPLETLNWFLEFAGGSSGAMLSNLLDRFHVRLLESGASLEIRERFELITETYSS